MMRFYSEALMLSPDVFSLIRGLIHDRLGLFYEDDKRDLLAEKLSALVLETGFDNFLDYYYLLRYDSDAASHWNRIMNALSVQETYFWREMDQIRALTNRILPEYAKAHPNETLRIWSAACATGEEPLTIAMALEEANLLNRHTIEIIASDASSRAIEKARAGRYRERSFRNLSESLKNRYFKGAFNEMTVIRTLHQKIRYGQANLLSGPEIASLAKSPFIFCRNVFIYFSEQSIRKVVDIFYEQMPGPGYLFVGSAESLLKLGTPFELEEIAGAFVYVKK